MKQLPEFSPKAVAGRVPSASPRPSITKISSQAVKDKASAKYDLTAVDNELNKIEAFLGAEIAQWPQGDPFGISCRILLDKIILLRQVPKKEEDLETIISSIRGDFAFIIRHYDPALSIQRHAIVEDIDLANAPLYSLQFESPSELPSLCIKALDSHQEVMNARRISYNLVNPIEYELELIKKFLIAEIVFLQRAKNPQPLTSIYASLLYQIGFLSNAGDPIAAINTFRADLAFIIETYYSAPLAPRYDVIIKKAKQFDVFYSLRVIYHPGMKPTFLQQPLTEQQARNRRIINYRLWGYPDTLRNSFFELNGLIEEEDFVAPALQPLKESLFKLQTQLLVYLSVTRGASHQKIEQIIRRTCFLIEHVLRVPVEPQGKEEIQKALRAYYNEVKPCDSTELNKALAIVFVTVIITLVAAALGIGLGYFVAGAGASLATIFLILSFKWIISTIVAAFTCGAVAGILMAAGFFKTNAQPVESGSKEAVAEVLRAANTLLRTTSASTINPIERPAALVT